MSNKIGHTWRSVFHRLLPLLLLTSDDRLPPRGQFVTKQAPERTTKHVISANNSKITRCRNIIRCVSSNGIKHQVRL